MPVEQYLRRRDIEQRIRLSRTSIYEKIAAGTFPKPVKLGARAVAWRESDIEAWLATRPVGVNGKG